MMAWMLNEKSFRNCFHILCVAAAISLSTYFIYTYNLNEDLCKVDYKSYFEDVEDKYPVLSICFKTFVINESMHLQSDKTSKSKYTDFLMGNFFDDNLLRINFTDVTANVINSVDSALVRYRNNTHKNWESPKKVLTEGFAGTWGEYLYKCYSVEVPLNKEIEVVEFSMKNDVFLNSLQTSYPYPLCNSIEKIKESQFSVTPSNSEIIPPCKEMEKVYYEYVEEDSDEVMEDVFSITVWYPDKKFKQITQTRAMDFNGLIGVIGGYIGLFLGYSFLQLPDVILQGVAKCKARLKSKELR